MNTPVLHARTFRLTYGDTDPAGILYYAAWFPKMENVQAEFFFLQGFRQDELRERFGWSTVTRATECEYLVPVGLFDEIRIDLRLGAIGASSIRFEFEMYRLPEQRLVARASIILVTIGADHRAIRIPTELRQRLEQWALKGTS